MRTSKLINSHHLVDGMIEHLFDQRRSCPIVVVTQSVTGRGPVISPIKLQERLGDLVHVYYLTPLSHRDFCFGVRNLFGIQNGIRMFARHMRLVDMPARHPAWTEHHIRLLGDDLYEELAKRARYKVMPPIHYKPKEIIHQHRPILSVRKNHG